VAKQGNKSLDQGIVFPGTGKKSLKAGPAETPAVLLGSWLSRTSGRVALDPFEILIL